MNLKLLLATMIFVICASFAVGQSASSGAASTATSNAASGQTATTGAATPAAPNAAVAPSATNTPVVLPQPSLVTPTVQDANQLNGLNQNFNTVPGGLNQNFNNLAPNDLNQNFNNINGANQNFNNVQGAQFGTNFDSVSNTDQQVGTNATPNLDTFGTPIGNGVVITPSGIPVLVTNPEANPFNTGISVNPTFQPATNGGISTTDLNAVNPNMPINVTTDSGTVLNTSGVQSLNGTLFPTITLGTTSSAQSVAVQVQGTSRSTSTILGRTTNVQGIVQRSDGTFTNVNND